MSYLTPEEVRIVEECRMQEYCSIACSADVLKCGMFYSRHAIDPDSHQIRTCPVCGRMYTDQPALSRREGVGEICPECGQKEALEDYEQHHGTLFGAIKDVLGGKHDRK